MADLSLGVVEERFAELIWQNAPIGSRELAELCARELSWKRPTTYNVLRKLCEKDLFQNVDGVVTPRISREAFYAMRGEQFVERTYGGSLPAFIAAFTARNKLTEEEADEIQRMINAARAKGSLGDTRRAGKAGAVGEAD